MRERKNRFHASQLQILDLLAPEHEACIFLLRKLFTTEISIRVQRRSPPNAKFGNIVCWYMGESIETTNFAHGGDSALSSLVDQSMPQEFFERLL